MLSFEKITTKHIEIYKKYYEGSLENSCENAFANLIIWGDAYNNMIAEKDGILFIKSGREGHESFRLPVGGDLKKGIELLKEYAKGEPLRFWAQEGPRLQEFTELYGQDYQAEPNRDAFDYIYPSKALALLEGKKYHSKRNHINAFSKRFVWKYEPITDENLPLVMECAEKWYGEKAPLEESMLFEREGVKTLLSNREKLGIEGGAVMVDGMVVAFTLGSAINDEVFDIHIEKALKDYAEAYTVINREFAKTLADRYPYINREDDMGIEGLRKAKLSYCPEKILEKYSIREKDGRIPECTEIYNKAFGQSPEFDKKLFGEGFKACRYILEEGKVASMAFTFPCKIKEAEGEHKAVYLYAAATRFEYKNLGFMTKLLDIIKKENDIVILRPANSSLTEFYKKRGFEVARGVASDSMIPQIEAGELLLSLSEGYRDTSGAEFELMYYSEKPLSLSAIGFIYSME